MLRDLQECLGIWGFPFQFNRCNGEEKNLYTGSGSILDNSSVFSRLCLMFENLPRKDLKHRMNIHLEEAFSLFSLTYVSIGNLQEVELKSVAAIVHDDTTADAVRPVLTLCFAVINISESCFSAKYFDRNSDTSDIPMANAAPRPITMP